MMTIKERKRKRSDLKSLLAKEKRMDRLADDKKRRIEDTSSIITSLEEEGMQFAQLTRPSRCQVLYQLLPEIKAMLDDGSGLLFLVRPIKCKSYKDASPNTLTEEQVTFAFEQIGVIRGHIGRLEGPVVEFLMVLHTKDVRRVPCEEDPLLRIHPKVARSRFGKAIPPLLVEQIDDRVTPTQLLYYPQSLNPYNHKEKPHYILNRNANHPDEDERVIKHVLDTRLNRIPLDPNTTSLKGTYLNFDKAETLAYRSGTENLNTEFGMFDHWANAIVDWEKVRQNEAAKNPKLLPLGTLEVVDSKPSEDGQEVSISFLTYSCPDACFAESEICKDSNGSCRFLNWKCPSKDWKPKPATRLSR